MIHLFMNLYPFIHIYTPVQEFGNLFRIYWQIYLQFVIQLSYLQQNSKGIYANYITLSVCANVCKYPLFVGKSVAVIRFFTWGCIEEKKLQFWILLTC